MPFGLCNAPSSFQRSMDTVLAGLKWRTCIVYLDDVLVFSSDFDSHLKNLEAVFQRFQEHGLKLNVSKCNFAQQELRYLGYVITPNGILPDPEKVSAVNNIAVPTTKSELKSFLGLTSYYRRFVNSYATVAAPLFRLLREATSFQWSQVEQDAFDRLKATLTSSPLLVHPDWTRAFQLQTDASDFAIASILVQRDDDGNERVICYGSRQLSDSERKYDTREKELLAVVWGCESFRKYLSGQRFTVETDHANLRWLMSGKYQTGRLARWVMRLQEFDFDVRHKPGNANSNADALSRLPTTTVPQQGPLFAVTQDVIELPSSDSLREQQESDPLLSDVMAYVKCPEKRVISPEVREVLRDTGTITVDDNTGLLMHQSMRNGRRHYVPILPPSTRRSVLRALHELPMAGHLGYKKTYHRIRSRFYWKGMTQDIKDFVRSCITCQARKTPQPRSAGLLQPFSASKPFEMVGVDIFGPLPLTARGNRYIVVMVDRFSRWTELSAVPDITATTVADAVVEHVVLRHGCPNQILSDRGSQFTSKLFRRIASRLGIKKVFTSPYHPQTNGQVERHNRYIAAALTAYVNDHQDDWDEYLQAVAFAYRTSLVDAIGNTPFYLVHGRDARLPTDVLLGNQEDLEEDVHRYGLTLTRRIKDAYDTARVCQEKSDSVRKKAYDAAHHPVDFEEGSLVLLHSSARKPGISPKLSKQYDGPYRVVQRMSDVTYKLSHVDSGKSTISHVQRILPLFTKVADGEEDELAESDNGSDWEDDNRQHGSGEEPVPEEEVRPVRSTAGRRPVRFRDIYD